eukprot:3348525-Amphidinium_carterae.2
MHRLSAQAENGRTGDVVMTRATDDLGMVARRRCRYISGTYTQRVVSEYHALATKQSTMQR